MLTRLVRYKTDCEVNWKAGYNPNFKTLHRHLSFLVRRWKLRLGAALYHWASPEINPFLSSAIRPLFHQSGVLSFILWRLLFIGVALTLAAYFREMVNSAFVNCMSDSVSNTPWENRVFSDNDISLMALVAAGLCGFAALIYGGGASQFFQRENLAGRLTQLRLLPLTETRLAFLTSAPAAFLSLALWAMLLPLWLMALFTDQWSWREFFGLPLLLLIIVVRSPAWAPLYETYVPSHTAIEEPAQEDKDKKDKDENDTSDKPELSGGELAASNANLDVNQEATHVVTKDTDHIEPDAYSVPKNFSDPTQQPLFKFDPSATITLVILWQIAAFGLRWMGFKTPPSALAYLLPHWREFLPTEVWNLLPSILLSWPLLLIQLLTTALPFYGVALPMGLWLVPRLLLSRYAAFSTFSITHQNTQTLQYRRQVRYWRAVRRLQAYLFWFYAAGFLWPWLCHKGVFAAVLPGAPINAAWARSGLWTVLIIIAAWIVQGQFHRVLEEPWKISSSKKLPEPSYSPRRTRATLSRWRRVWRSAQGLLLWPIAIYFVLCWLGGTSGVDSVWLSRLPATLITMAACLLADFSGLALKRALPEPHKVIWPWLRFYWFWGLGWEAAFRVVWAHYTGQSFELRDAPHVMLSPIVSLLTLLNSDITLPWQGALWQIALSCVLFALAVRLTFQPQSKILPSTIATSVEASPREISIFWRWMNAVWRAIWFMPLLLLRLLFWPVKTSAIAVYSAALYLGLKVKPFLDRQAQEFWRYIDNFDNPILSRGLRNQRKDDAALQWLLSVGLQLAFFLILLCFALFQPLLILCYGGNTEYNRQAALAMINWRGWGDVVFWVTLAYGLLPNLGALFSHTGVFDKERANGGIVFLFLTPQTESQIIGGHLGAIILPGLWFHCALYPSLLLAALLEIMAGHAALLPLMLLLVLLLHALLPLSAMTSLWSAVHAKNAGEGGGWMLVFGLVPQGILVVATVMVVLATQGFWAQAAIVLGIVLCLAGTSIFWHDALRCLHRERFGDVSLKGTIAN